MNFPDLLVILFSKLLSRCITLFNLGSGATWPGEIALRLRPNILREFMKQSRTVIFIAGTNGKTTTSKMIDTILSYNGKKVHRNDSGANLDNGVVSSFIEDASYNGKLRSTYFIFEIDEATLPKLLHNVSPTVIVLLNLFRDQLDRYGEVDAIADKWLQVLKSLPKDTKFIINGDDPALAYIGKNAPSRVFYFGLDDPKAFSSKVDHATDSIYCPNCGHRLTFGGVYFSHLGKWACGHCGFLHPDLAVRSEDFVSPIDGTYNRYNTLAAALTARELGLSDEQIKASLATFQPAFGRMEQVETQGKKIQILLSKNPTGFNESLRTVLSSEKNGPLLFVLNDRIPDGRDVSWIWDVDMEMLQDQKNRTIYISGDRAYDLGVRIKYAGISKNNYIVCETLEEAVENATQATKAEETLSILATYSGMLEVRKNLVGRKIL